MPLHIERSAFGPYLPNDSMRDLCLNTAQILWKNKVALESGQGDVNILGYASGFHALCAYCDWNADCPKFHDGEHQLEWQMDLERLAHLKNTRTALDAKIEELESGLKDAYTLSGMSGNWINAGSHRFRVTQQAGRHAPFILTISTINTTSKPAYPMQKLAFQFSTHFWVQPELTRPSTKRALGSKYGPFFRVFGVVGIWKWGWNGKICRDCG